MLKIIRACLYYLPTKMYLLRLIKANPNKTILVIPQSSMGDASIAMAYSYKSKKPLLVLAHQKNSFFLSNYQIQSTFIWLSDKAMKKFDYFSGVIRHFTSGKIIECMKDGDLVFGHQSAYILTRKHCLSSELSALGIIRDFGFFAHPNDMPIYASIPKIENTKITKWFDNNRNIKKVFINNCSDSSEGIDEISMNRLIDGFVKLNYKVFINEIPKDNMNGEVCFDNSIVKLPCTMSELFYISSTFDFIVSLRSGVLDILAGQNKNIIAIHTKKEWFNLYKMEHWKNGAKDYLFKGKETVDDIINYVANGTK